jgi:hypothetical protein
MTTPTDQPGSNEAINTQPVAHIPRVASIAAEAETQEVITAPKGRHHWIVILVIVLLAAIAAATVSFIAYGGNLQSTSDAYVEGRIIRISPRVSGPVLLAAFAIALGERAATRYHEDLTYPLEGRT